MRGNGQETETDIDSTDRQGFIKLARPSTSHLTPRRAVGHPIRPPPPHAISHLPPPPESGGQTSHQAAVTPGTWKDGDRIQRVAAMRVTRVATASGSGKATSGEQTSPTSSVDSLFRSRTYADFITDVELQQAKAEVEECYRRRAWRAGMGDMLPVGWPMTEEELEDL